jgi:hypothetical protein
MYAELFHILTNIRSYYKWILLDLQIKLQQRFAGFSDQELQSIFLKMQTFQTGLCVMLANDLFTESVDDDRMMHMMDEAAEDFIRAARLRKQQET